MKLFKWLAMVFVMMFVFVGCIDGLTSIKPDTSTETVLGLVMKAVDKCDLNENGQRILEIPHKEYAKNRTQFFAVKWPDGKWAVGLINEATGAVLALICDTTEANQWFVQRNEMVLPISEEDARDSLREWLGLIVEKGDFAKAGPWKPFEPKGTKT